MTLNRREKILAIATGSLMLPFVGWLLWGILTAPIADRNGRKEQLEEIIQKQLDDALKYDKSKRRLVEWRRRALPSNVDRASTLYRAWLLELVEKSGFRRHSLQSGQPSPRRIEQRIVYTTVPFTIRAQANLEQLTRFLHGFYSAGHLHVVRRLTLKPAQNPNDLDVVVAVEALSMTEADRRDELTAVTPASPPAELAAYVKTIAQRNFFTPYQPATPTPPVQAFDPSKHAYVTGIVSIDGERRVWLKARTTDETFVLRSGDTFKVGSFEGKIGKINEREAEITSGDKSLMIPLGDSLTPPPKEEPKPGGPPPTAAGGPPSGPSAGPPPGAPPGPPPGMKKGDGKRPHTPGSEGGARSERSKKFRSGKRPDSGA